MTTDKTLVALAQMVSQYLEHKDGLIRHEFMTAQENALEALEDAGLIVCTEHLETYKWAEGFDPWDY